MGMDVVKTVLTFLILGLLCAILILVLINAIRRTFFDSTNRGGGHHHGGGGSDKCIDLYARDLAQLVSMQSIPGMTALIDKGITNLETGIYMLQQEDRQWVKIGVPEEGERYRILRGEESGKLYTIRASYVNEIREPTETQILDNEHLSQELAEDTSIVHVASNVSMSPSIRVPNTNVSSNSAKSSSNNYSSSSSAVLMRSTFAVGRQVIVRNTSPLYSMTFIIGSNQVVVVEPSTIRTIHLNLDQTSSQPHYVLGATSS